MRHELLKLKKGKSTKAERMFVETLKFLHIPFKAKVKVGGHEVDFLVGDKAIEINGHEQSSVRNADLIALGFTPIHFSNKEVLGNVPLLKKYLNDYTIKPRQPRP